MAQALAAAAARCVADIGTRLSAPAAQCKDDINALHAQVAELTGALADAQDLAAREKRLRQQAEAAAARERQLWGDALAAADAALGNEVRGLQRLQAQLGKAGHRQAEEGDQQQQQQQQQQVAAQEGAGRGSRHEVLASAKAAVTAALGSQQQQEHWQAAAEVKAGGHRAVGEAGTSASGGQRTAEPAVAAAAGARAGPAAAERAEEAPQQVPGSPAKRRRSEPAKQPAPAQPLNQMRQARLEERRRTRSSGSTTPRQAAMLKRVEQAGGVPWYERLG